MKLSVLQCVAASVLTLVAVSWVDSGVALAQEGRTIGVAASAPVGDGRFTESDLAAVTEYSLWGWSQLLDGAGSPVQFDQNAHARMAEYWTFVWPYLDADQQASFSIADGLWPTMQTMMALDESNVQAYLDEFAGVFQMHWTGIEEATLQYLLGMISGSDYAVVVQQRYQASGDYAGNGNQQGENYGYTESLGNYVVGPKHEIISDAAIDNIGAVGSWDW